MNKLSDIVIVICILIVAFLGFLTSFGILSLIISHRQQYPINTSMLLLCNTYITILFTCLNVAIMHVYSLCGEFYENTNFDSWWCHVHAYILHVGVCSIYYSYLLQAFFRFFRVVLYQYRRLQSFQCMLGFILIEWLISFLWMMLILFLNDFEYISQNYYCQISFSDFRGLLTAVSVIYFGPTFTSVIIYIYIMYHLKHMTTSRIQQNRTRSNQRDLIVLRRIIILIVSVLFLSLPILIIWLLYLFTDYLNPLSYHLEWLLFAISSSILSLASAILSPNLSRLITIQWRRPRQIQPIVINNANQDN